MSRAGFEPALSRCMTQISTFSDRDFGNPVRLRLESKTKEDYIRGHPAGTLVIDAKLIGPGPTKLIFEEKV